MNSNTSALLTDLYMLTMLQGFFHEGMEEPATYEFFVRFDARRGFLAAGLEQVLEYPRRYVSASRSCVARFHGGFDQDFVDNLGSSASAAMCTPCRRARSFRTNRSCA
jgi:nicotinate phosphoribosyltransferase